MIIILKGNFYEEWTMLGASTFLTYVLFTIFFLLSYVCIIDQ